MSSVARCTNSDARVPVFSATGWDKPPAAGSPDADKKLAEIRKKKVEVLVNSMCIFAGVLCEL